MVIINAPQCGQKTYTISVFREYNRYGVSANSESEAINIVADYLYERKLTHLYYENSYIAMLALCSEYRRPKSFAAACNLTCCGSHNIYLKIIRIDAA